MGLLKGMLKDAGYAVVADARVMLVVRKSVELSIHQDGKVILKSVDRAEAEVAYADLRPHIEAAWNEQ